MQFFNKVISKAKELNKKYEEKCILLERKITGGSSIDEKIYSLVDKVVPPVEPVVTNANRNEVLRGLLVDDKAFPSNEPVTKTDESVVVAAKREVKKAASITGHILKVCVMRAVGLWMDRLPLWLLQFALSFMITCACIALAISVSVVFILPLLAWSGFMGVMIYMAYTDQLEAYIQ